MATEATANAMRATGSGKTWTVSKYTAAMAIFFYLFYCVCGLQVSWLASLHFFLREQKWCNHGLDSIEIDNDLSGMVEVV
jgi:hypothetical protein